MNHKMLRHRQQGVALITALLIMALLASLSLRLSWDNAMDVRRTMTMLYHDEGSQAALGAESWVMSMLRDDAEDSQTDHLGEIWAAEMPVLPIESDTIQGVLHGNVQDLQGRFNVNNLVRQNGNIDQQSLEQFRRLLEVLNIDPRFADLSADWIDADQNAELAGAEDAIYLGMIPPYRSANQHLTSVSELAALEGMDKATFDVLLPHIVALPGRTEINVNTATFAVLRSLSDGISNEIAESLMSERAESGFANIENTFAPYLGAEVARGLRETSDYFQLKVVVQIDTVRITYFSVLQRDPQRGTVVPILRSFGTI
ncbi:MAG: type II secretion system minor pseudopilin GspK [Proteobacteria bacterium]|nr:type II secretion system minor pseudopilin GspK [Pseudomonadota bacterium]